MLKDSFLEDTIKRLELEWEKKAARFLEYKRVYLLIQEKKLQLKRTKTEQTELAEKARTVYDRFGNQDSK